MQLNPMGSNRNEIAFGNGAVVFFSYKTPVAALVDGAYYRTDKKWSVTTSRHINQWLDGAKAEAKPQEYFDGLVLA